MVVLRVDSVWSGPLIAGGGFSSHWFDNGSADAQACVDAVEDFWDAALEFVVDTAIVTIQSQTITYNETDGVLLGFQPVSSPGPQQGASASEALPPANQGLIRLSTSGVRNSRQIRGRLFLPGPSEVHSEGGVPTATYRNGVSAAAQALADDATANWCVFSRPVAGSGGEIPAVLAASVWTKWGVLRSRRD